MDGSVNPEELLSRTPFFEGLSASGCAAVARRMRPVRFGSGEAIFSRGDPGKDLYLVLTGRVRLSVLTAEGRELALVHAARGELFGEMAVIDGGPRSADATAITETRALSLPRAALFDLMRDEPGVALVIAQFLCGRLRETNAKLESIALLPIVTRLARFLLATTKRNGGPRQKFTLDMTQSELALLLGATRPKINAALKALEDLGAISREADGMLTCNVTLLTDAAGTEASEL